ncbi:ABC transporter substrate-binding protein [Paenibacillus eucommiae]|uniref:Multiple sugar transport system substrate-binding protein n=1 Tax=Paenibacillus eucommiae TaxID=1355755 RepID=A0ABS4ISX4_9BACL|nr:sugar ABC transporter substrate-binding protein [Paenibacillus eucommiae]MBP1990679.1 multiple sugar transport system substrate-binding protein [Paenibacillus eucommiae]
MKKKQVSVLAILVLLLAVALMSGCGSTKDTNEGSSPAPSVSPSAGKDEGSGTTKGSGDTPVELVFWTYPVLNLPGQKAGEYNANLVAKFEKKYPNVKVKLEIIPYDGGDQKVNVALASNTAPDIFNDYPGRTTGYAKRGYTVPLNDLITPEQLKQIPKNILDLVSLQDGTIFSYPQGLGGTMFVINKTLVEQAGAADLLPKGEMRTWTFDEFEQLLQKVKDYQKKEEYPLLLFGLNEQGDMLYHTFMAGFGGSKFSEDRMTSVMNSAENVKAVEWIKSLVDKKLVYPNPETRAATMSQDYFVQGKTAVIMGGLNVRDVVKKAKEDGVIEKEFETMLVPFPSKEKDKGVIVPGGGAFVVFNNKDELKIEYAKKFVQFAVTEDPEFILAMNALDVYGRDVWGSNPDAEQLWFSKVVTNSEQISGVDLSYDIDGYSQTRAVFFPEMQAVFIGTKTPQQAMDDFVKKANKIIKDASASKK